MPINKRKKVQRKVLPKVPESARVTKAFTYGLRRIDVLRKSGLITLEQYGSMQNKLNDLFAKHLGEANNGGKRQAEEFLKQLTMMKTQALTKNKQQKTSSQRLVRLAVVPKKGVVKKAVITQAKPKEAIKFAVPTPKGSRVAEKEALRISEQIRELKTRLAKLKGIEFAKTQSEITKLGSNKELLIDYMYGRLSAEHEIAKLLSQM